MHTIGSTRGQFIVCDTCIKILKQEGLVDQRDRAMSDDISAEFCPNCFDHNRVLIDDLAGSTE